MISAPSPLHCVVFDSDGLVFETARQWRRAEERLFARHGVEHGDDTSDAFFGRGRIDTERILTSLFGVPDARAPELFDELEELVIEELKAGCATMPGAQELVKAVRDAGVSVGLASNSPRSVVRAVLAGESVRGDWFDVVVTADEVESPKPAPDVYVETCARLSAHPAQSIALDDSSLGVTAAAAAGMFVVYVPSSSAQAPNSDADLTVPSLTADELWTCMRAAGAIGAESTADGDLGVR